jgi:hypothetical protein
MVRAESEIIAAIDWYTRRGKSWISVVTYIGICHLFGGWSELCRQLRAPYSIRGIASRRHHAD